MISWDASPCFREEKIPAVVYGYRNEFYDYVVLDEEQMIIRALEHLKRFGHRRIGILSVGERNRFFRWMRSASFTGSAAESFPMR